MHCFLIGIGLIVFALGLRGSRHNLIRKFGALGVLAACFFLAHGVFGHWTGGCVGALAWFFLPWIDIILRFKEMQIPLNNRIYHYEAPNLQFFPNASEAYETMEACDFEYVSNGKWEWLGMEQYMQIFWHPEERSLAVLALCEYQNVAFSCLSILSHTEDGKILKTSNFPFSSILKLAPHVALNHLPCEKNCFCEILEEHQHFLKKKNILMDQLKIPDPDTAEAWLEQEMKQHLDYNFELGIIQSVNQHQAMYSMRGLFFLWWQMLRDLLRLC